MGNKVIFIIIGLLILVLVIPILNKVISNKSVSDEYKKITFKEMRDMINDEEITDYVILDVRTPAEYNEKRIPNSILIPDYEIEQAETKIKDKDQYIFVYCRSGNRSKTATKNLVKMGYTKVYDVGGIIDYPYELEY